MFVFVRNASASGVYTSFCINRDGTIVDMCVQLSIKLKCKVNRYVVIESLQMQHISRILLVML